MVRDYHWSDNRLSATNHLCQKEYILFMQQFSDSILNSYNMPVQRNLSIGVLLVNPNRPIINLPPRAAINDIFFGQTSVASYWREVSNGNITITNTVVFDWLNLEGADRISFLALTGIEGPQLRVREAIRLFNHQIGTATFDGFILIDADTQLGGGGQAADNQIYTTLSGFNIGLVTHEMGHWLGLQHSAGDKNGTGYDDKWDLMSYGNVYLNQPVGLSPNYVNAPWLCALFLNHFDWATGAYKKLRSQITADETIVLRPLSSVNNQTGTYRMAIVEMDHKPDGIKFSIELRIKQGLDGGLPGPAVLIHKWQYDGTPLLFAYRMSNDPAFARYIHNNEFRQWYKGRVFIDWQHNLRFEIIEDGTTGNGRAVIKIGDTRALEGDLFWYNHNSRKIDTGTEWKGRELVSREERWDTYKHIFSSGEGVIYAITEDTGNLKWRKHLGWTNGKQRWTAWKTIGRGGWNTFDTVFSGGNGVIYGYRNNGELTWFRHIDWLSGGDTILGSKVISNDIWSYFIGGWDTRINLEPKKFVFSGGHGLIYAVIPSYERAEQYDLILFRQEDWENGSDLWADYSDVDAKGHSLVGWGGWDKIRINGIYKYYKSFFADEAGSIYAVTEDGELWWWHHNRRFWGETITDGPIKIGDSGWEKCKFVFSGYNGVIYSVIE